MAAPLIQTPLLELKKLLIRDQFDCAAAQRAAREMTSALRFDENAREEVVLVVAELATNLVRHAGQGILTLKLLQGGGKLGIEVDALDRGPGMKNVDRSLVDGHSSAGSLGYGLGTVNRLMDEMDIQSAPEMGTHIICRRWLREREQIPISRLWDADVATRSRRLARENGDTFVIKEWQGKLLAGVIDGLGHGEFARNAALAAQNYVERHYDMPLDKIFSGAGRACRGTRGAVMALARFESQKLLSFASLGNVETKVWGGPEKVQLMVKRGILGLNEREVAVQENKWSPDWVLVLHSDGLSSDWHWHDFPGLEREPADIIARTLLRNLAARDDDATVMAIRSLCP